MAIIISTAHHCVQVFHSDGFLTRAEWDQEGSKGFQEEGGGLLRLLDTGHPLNRSQLFCLGTPYLLFITNYSPYIFKDQSYLI